MTLYVGYFGCCEGLIWPITIALLIVPNQSRGAVFLIGCSGRTLVEG